MFFSVCVVCWGFSTREIPLAGHGPVLHVRAAHPLLGERLSLWPDALLGLPALGRERMVICYVLYSRLFVSWCCSCGCNLCAAIGRAPTSVWSGLLYAPTSCHNISALCCVLLVFVLCVMNCQLSFCSWNVRGLGQTTRRDDVLAELISARPTFVVLQETKLQSLEVHKPSSFLPFRLRSCVARDAIGASGGMLTAWD